MDSIDVQTSAKMVERALNKLTAACEALRAAQAEVEQAGRQYLSDARVPVGFRVDYQPPDLSRYYTWSIGDDRGFQVSSTRGLSQQPGCWVTSYPVNKMGQRVYSTGPRGIPVRHVVQAYKPAVIEGMPDGD